MLGGMKTDYGILRRRGLKRWALAVGAVCALGLWSWAGEAVISTATLLQDMVNLRAMAEFPSPYYTCKQFSSYDRRSKTPADPKTWFANGDRGHYLRVEERNGRKEYVMMDADGPGAVVRIWSANPRGTLRIYLDGSDTPVLEAPMADLLGGKFPGLPRPIAGEYSRGWNLYFPIPYARHCKITSDQGDFYYHVDYRTYEKGTVVKSFTLQDLKALQPQIQALVRRLEHPRTAVDLKIQARKTIQETLQPGERYQLDLQGPAAICEIVLRVQARDLDRALRGTVLRIDFDGEPCVEAPLGDFFGSMPGINPFEALPLGMTKDGEMYCHWFMPFRDGAHLELVNWSPETLTIQGRVGWSSYRWTDRSMHFRAKWRVEFEIPTRPMRDWNYLTTFGTGVFGGVAFAIDNPVKAWWGEGDEKIYVDGETFPSFFGTGTEDYYGYAWGSPELFTHAYHSQSRCDGPANYGRTSVNRFHILDRIPFQKSFRFDIELWHWRDCKVNMAVTAYWYAKPGAVDGFQTLGPEDLQVWPMPKYQPPRVKGAIEGESMRIVRVVGKVEPQDWAGLSGERHLWWHAGMKPGDQLILAFPVSKAGRYRVLARFLKARDYGIHQLAINGKKTGKPIDFYNPTVVPTKEVDLGVWDLRKGNNYLTVTVVGANPKAVKAYMFGLDYIRLVPVK